MDKIHQNTLSLLKTALFGCLPALDALSADEWEALFEYAKSQSVAAVCFESVQILPPHQKPPKPLYIQWALLTEQTAHRFAQQKQAVAEVVNSVAGLKVLIIKGISNAKNYPVPSHRVSGDIDIFCFDKSHELDRSMESRGIYVDYTNPRHSIFNINGFTVENHKYFLYRRNEEELWLDQFLVGEAEKSCDLSQKSILPGTPLGNAVFFLKHAECDFVFFRPNIKLRALCDWTMMLANGGLDYQELNKIKAGKTIDRFADALTAVSVRWLGLPPSFLDFFPPISEKILNDFIYMALHYQHQEELRGTFRGRMQRLWKYLRHFRTYKYIFGRNIIKWYYFEKYNKSES